MNQEPKNEGLESVEKNIDTIKTPNTRSIYEHDTSLGVIEWDKEKYKNALYSIPQEEGNLALLGEKVFEIIKNEKIPVLNANVLNYLLENKDQIPEEWKGKTIFFLGTVLGGLSEKDSRHFVEYLYFNEREGWHSSMLNVQSIFLDGSNEHGGEFAAVLAQ